MFKTWFTKNKTLIVLIVVFISILILLGLIGSLSELFEPMPNVRFGATFSSQYANSLGLDSRKVFISALDDLKIKYFRIPAYWEDIEKEQGKYNFDELDWILKEAGSRNAKAIMAIGYKLPRWPECHAPQWANMLSPDERRTFVLPLIREIVNRYKNNPTILAWQVENEPFFEAFGECPKLDKKFFENEIALVKELDSRPIIVTESGELSTWLSAARSADILGISMYRVSWNKYLGYIYYPLSPRFYRERVKIIKNIVDDVIVSELQAEPWVPAGILNASVEEQFKSMNPERLKDNISFVRRAGFGEAYLWGIEWWYWLKEKQNNSSFWDLGKEIYK